MKLLDEQKKKAILNITPLIDVLFILIIFFTVSSTFLEQPGIKLQLPKAQSAEAQRTEKAVLFISKDSELFLGDAAVTLAQLPQKVRELMENRPEKTLIISADEKVPHGLVVNVMDIARANLVERLVISTEPKN